MPLQIEFEAAAADRGTLRVRGLPEVGAEVLVAVQRLTDERYLTMHGRWDAAASWYPCPRLDADETAIRFTVSAALSAGIRDAAPDRLRIHLRRRDFSDSGALAIRAPGPPHALPPVPLANHAPPAAGPPDRAPLAPATGAGAFARRGGTPRLRWYTLLALCLVCLATLTWWRYTPSPSAPGPAVADPTGKDLADDLQRQNLPPPDLLRRAEAADRAGDCEAAIRLFVAAARRDGACAEALARRYDPMTRQASPCFAEPKPDSALEWYRRAAEAGIPRAQRRYGESLLGEDSSGPVYREAIHWLRKAAAAGDTTATDRLTALGER